MNNKIKDKSNDRKYRIEIPQIVWAKVGNVYELSLWLTVKMIAGESGECYLSTPDLAAAAMMSAGKASQCRRSLIASNLLQGSIRRDPGYPQPVWHITIPDLWPENIKWRQNNASLKDRIENKRQQRVSLHPMKDEKEPSPDERGLSPGERGTSPDETKKNHKEEPPKKLVIEASASTSPPKKISRLAADTQEAQKLFERIGENQRAKGRKGTTKFPTLECKDKFDTAAEILNGEFNKALTKALEQGITSVTGVTNYISKWASNLKPRHHLKVKA